MYTSDLESYITHGREEGNLEYISKADHLVL